MILTTTSTLREARYILQGLLKARLIACGNIMSPIESHFFWKNKNCIEKERLVILKTQEKNFSKIRKFILENHSYEVPEIILIPIKKGFDKYLNWMNQVLNHKR